MPPQPPSGSLVQKYILAIGNDRFLTISGFLPACTLPETNIAPQKNRPFAPKGNENVFQPSIFRCEHVSLREGNLGFQHLNQSLFEINVSDTEAVWEALVFDAKGVGPPDTSV